MKDSSVTPSDFDVQTVVGEGFDTGATVDDDVIYITFTQGTTWNTGDTPTISYTQGTLTDLAGNLMGTSGATATTDKAVPVIMSRTTLDNDTNGEVDYVKVVWSETRDDSTVAAVDAEIPTRADTVLTESFTPGVPGSGLDKYAADVATIY